MWYAGGAGGDDAADGCNVHAPGVRGTGRGKADKGHARGRGRGKKARGGDVVPPPAKWCLHQPQRWVPPAAMRRVLWTLVVLVWRCRARLPNFVGSILHCLHAVIPDFRPPSVAESCEAALRRLLAGCAVEGYALTCDDAAPGSLTVFQSSRVARPQDASKEPNIVLVLTWIRTSSVFFVLFLKLLTWKRSWDWPVGTLIKFSSTTGVTTWVSSMTW